MFGFVQLKICALTEINAKKVNVNRKILFIFGTLCYDVVKVLIIGFGTN